MLHATIEFSGKILLNWLFFLALIRGKQKKIFFRNMLCHVIADMPIMQFVIEGDFVHTDTLNIFSASSHCIMQNSCHTKYVFLLLFYFSLIWQTNIQSFIESNIFFLICKANVHMTTFSLLLLSVYADRFILIFFLFAKIPTQMTVK